MISRGQLIAMRSQFDGVNSIRVMVDLATGDTFASVCLESVVREHFDVTFPPGVRHLSAIGLKTNEITRRIAVDEGYSTAVFQESAFPLCPATADSRCAQREVGNGSKRAGW